MPLRECGKSLALKLWAKIFLFLSTVVEEWACGGGGGGVAFDLAPDLCRCQNKLCTPMLGFRETRSPGTNNISWIKKIDDFLRKTNETLLFSLPTKFKGLYYSIKMPVLEFFQ